MADYVAAWIEIGGLVPGELVSELIDCIRSDGLSTKFGGNEFAPRSVEELLALARDAER
jgi:hypothetical protein